MSMFARASCRAEGQSFGQGKRLTGDLDVGTDKEWGMVIKGLVPTRVYSPTDVMMLIKRGAANRKVRATQFNQHSSRAHTVRGPRQAEEISAKVFALALAC